MLILKRRNEVESSCSQEFSTVDLLPLNAPLGAQGTLFWRTGFGNWAIFPPSSWIRIVCSSTVGQKSEVILCRVFRFPHAFRKHKKARAFPGTAYQKILDKLIPLCASSSLSKFHVFNSINTWVICELWTWISKH
jgi:hypothetical protein